MAATDRFEMRIDPKDRARWEEQARREGRTLARWLTVLANREIDPNAYIRAKDAEKARKHVARRERGVRALDDHLSGKTKKK